MWTHRVDTSDGRIVNGTHYESDAAALRAVGEHYGWAEPVVGPAWPEPLLDGSGLYWCATVYPSQAECDADQDGAEAGYYPVIVELAEPLADVER